MTNKAIALHEGRHLDDALVALKTAISLAPEDPVILLNLGTALLKEAHYLKRLIGFNPLPSLHPPMGKHGVISRSLCKQSIATKNLY